eukprot:15474144-Alexandrium_andersonii.AAC.1
MAGQWEAAGTLPDDVMDHIAAPQVLAQVTRHMGGQELWQTRQVMRGIGLPPDLEPPPVVDLRAQVEADDEGGSPMLRQPP